MTKLPADLAKLLQECREEAAAAKRQTRKTSVYEATAHIAAYYAQMGDAETAEHFELISMGCLSYLSAGAARRRAA